MAAVERVILPPTVEPIHYSLSLHPNLDNLVFSCDEIIDVEVVTACNCITMHSREIHVKEASFKNVESGVGPSLQNISYHLVDNTVTLTFDGELPIGKGIVTIAFDGILNGDMAGFYRSGYTDADGNKKIMANTQFAALDARKAFICWDEPERKATFSVTMTVPNALTAISNMPAMSTKMIPNGKKKIVFDISPKMSTYLLAWAVGEFDYVQGMTQNGVTIRVFTPPGRGEEGWFALNLAVRALDFYDDFFKIPYPLPKCDMLCCTEFAMGAMENWGLVTYREVDLLIDQEKGNATTSRKQRVAIVVAHELAHQWFGNLVTMEWWDDIWLNEGFAAFSEHFCVDALFPDYKIWDQFTTDAMGTAMRLDALRTSHPIQVPIARAEEVEQVFDAISYCKGSTVVRMARCVVGAANFQKGLQIYMKRHSYGNTKTIDLWNAWTEATGGAIDVAQLMHSWTSKMGYPYLTVVDEKFEDNKVTFTLEQNWFLADGGDEASAEASKTLLWSVPLMFATSTYESSQAVIMNEKRQTFTLDLHSKDDWLKINAGQQAMVRVAHSKEMIRRLTPVITSRKGLSAVDRGALLLDTYALAKAGYVPVESVVELLRGYTDEDCLSVWSSLSGVLQGLNLLMEEVGGAAFDAYKAFAKKIVMAAFVKVGWTPKDTDGHSENLLRSTLIGLLDCFCGSDEEVLKEARTRFDAHFEDPSVLPADIKNTVYRIVLQNATGDVEYNKLLTAYHATEDNSMKKFVMSCLGSTNNPILKMKTLDWAVKGDDVKLQDFFYCIGGVSSSAAGVAMTWKYYKDVS